MRDGTFHGHPDHDACGTGLIVRLGQPASHEVVDRGLVALQRMAQDHGLKWLGWRKVPVNHSVLGLRAAETAPAIWQCFLAGGDCSGHGLLKRNPSLCIPVEFQAGAKAQFNADPSTALKGRSSAGAKDTSIGRSSTEARDTSIGCALDHCNGDYQSGQGQPDVDFEEKLESE